MDLNAENAQHGTNLFSSRPFGKDNCRVLTEKKSQIDTESDKNPEILKFQRFYAIFPQFLTDFVDWNIEKGQQGKNV